MYDVNSAQNPSFVLGTSVESRRNFAIDPGPTATHSGRWGFSLATTEAVTSAWVSTPGAGPEGRTGYVRHTVTTAKTAGVGGPRYLSTAADMSGLNGDARRLSVWVRFSVATTATIVGDVRSVASATIRGTATASVAVAANTWTRLSVTVYANAAYDGAQILVTTAAGNITPIGGWYDMANVLVEAGENLLPYFDHTSSPDVDYTPSSVGVVNASPSILSYVRPTGISFGGIRSTQWAADGTTSLRVDVGTAGVTGVWASPVVITARYAGQSATFGSVTKVSTAPGEVLSWPVGTTSSLSLGVGYWDCLGLGVEYYFSGSTPSDTTWTYAWSGTVNASASTRTATPGLYVTAQVSDPEAAPRTAITITGLDPLGPSKVTVYRSTQGGVRRKVRGVSGAQMYGSGFAVDYEAPLGRPVNYEMVVESGAVIPLRLTDSATLNATSGYIQDPLQPLSVIAVATMDTGADTAILTSKAFRKLSYALESTSVNVIGSREPIAMTGQRMRAGGIDFSILTEAAEQSSRLRELLMQAPIVVIRPLPSWGPLPDVIYTVPTVSEEPVYGEDGVIMTTWNLTGDSVRAPTMSVLVPLWTYDAVQALWVTYQDIQTQATATTSRYLDVQADPTIGA